MKYITNQEAKLLQSVVTLGKFDGVHVGHRKLIEYAMAQKEKGLQSVVFSFLFQGNNLLIKDGTDMIYTEKEKYRVLGEMGVDVFWSYPFDKNCMQMEAEEFVEKVLVGKVGAKEIVVGNDFHFGRQRKGDVALLKKLADQFGYTVTSLDKVNYEGEPVSSTRIRGLIKNGDMETVNQLLGKPYHITETVVHGRQIGRTLGIPTINMVPQTGKLLPPNGVYASTTMIDGKAYAGITNIGVKPTVGSDSVIAETHIFDLNRDLYDQELTVSLYKFQRKEQKFGSVEELKQTMEQDCRASREYFSKELFSRETFS
ncbi:MAG: bifunctional riboflavin kinase/FAD synthetase [Lachnospiraceae bacterium]|nr:bifunctional riboflavin kinase/FAD synthetase [Lachnospiraceae bacterium]